VRRTSRIAIALVLALGLVGLTGTTAEAAPVATPWGLNDTIGEASRPNGDIGRVVISNGRQAVNFLWKMQAAPFWDNTSVARSTRTVFEIDWQGTTPAYNRRLVISRYEGTFTSVVFNGIGGSECIGYNTVRIRPGLRYDVTVPTVCLGGAHVLRVATRFLDDRDNGSGEDIRIDKVPNAGYSPFIRLPAGSGSPAPRTVGSWTVL
jgi:hypothetical protein